MLRPMEQDRARILAAELVGTAVLMIGGVGTAVLAGDRVGVLGVALGFGLALMIMTYVVGRVSCHLNPAVTLALLLARRIGAAHALFAVIGQLVGAALGGAIVLGIANGRDDFRRGEFASNLWSGDRSGLGATIVVEVVLTALVVLVVLTWSRERATPGLGGVMYGLALVLVHLVSFPVDGTSVNPARSIGTAVYATLDSGALEQLWAFVVFPLLGAVVGVIVWLMVDESRLEDTLLVEVPGAVAARDALDEAVDEVIDD